MSITMKSKLPISAIIIYNSKAENKYLKNAKESVSSFAQTILFDVGDGPIKNFSQIRNQAIKLADQDYVLFIDSDEELTRKSLPKIKRIVEQKFYDLVSVNRSDYFLGKRLRYGEAGNIHLVRLGKKEKLKFHRSVHETVQIDPKLKMTGSDILLLHYSHASISDFLKKVSYYSFLESQLRKQKIDFSLWFELLFFPPLKFLFNFFIRQGYRDGVRGLIYALIMSLHSFFVRVNLFEKNLKIK